MKTISWFKEISKDNISIVGGKGANLGEMYNLGMPVPPGFMVNADAYKEFIERANIKEKITQILSGLNVENNEELQNKANEVQKLIIATEIPDDIKEEIIDAYESMGITDKPVNAAELVKKGEDEFVAVRSSATAEDLPEASFAGQQATFLNIKGSGDVVKAVRACWASLFTARAIYYRIKNNFEHMQVLIAVVVQKMVNSQKAGITFSINPSTNNESEIIVEACFGLGEAIVSGSVNPDSYIVDKSSMKIKSKDIKEQEWAYVRDETGKTVKKTIIKDKRGTQILKDEEILGLAEIAKKLEDHYNKPQDIEWAIEGGKIYVVQTRPITTMKKIEDEKTEEIRVEEQKEEEQADEKGTNISDAKVLVTGNTASPGFAFGIVKIANEPNEFSKVQKGDVLVTKMTNPDMVPVMKRASAIVTDMGGTTCHAAIVSREMGIPCIVGTGNSTSVLKENTMITVDATHGKVYEGKITIKKPKQAEETKEEYGELITATQIKVVMDFPDYAEKAAATGADGVGLLRAEHMILGSKVHPAYLVKQGRKQELIDILVKGISTVARAFDGKPVWYRTLDAPTDEFKSLEGGEDEPQEENPMLGWRGIRRSLDQRGMLKAEFEAIKKVHEMGLKNVGVMIPLVTRVDEVKQAKETLEEVFGDEFVEFGIMVETPAAVWIIEDICKLGIDFISFGTNDLTQYTLAIDRNNDLVQKHYDELHPAVLAEISMVIKACKKYHVQTSICGQAGSQPKMAAFLVRQGIDSISANPDAVHQIRHTVAITEKRLLLDAERRNLRPQQ
ncbi:phosphoenolpyruvate synthase [Candidatus Woesearchaeota archaeon CG1_02_33_12]|nr:MAG: phosphoenolpyruvate synthase [Candidatus Woesearchaeota archaeon CG1_02_33_12]PIN79230.1 MAG: phosphoenolpyruvate synthase [Candidatus Woesearchaeota archaeon CG10_big_fil_rev_8_21_14_0_10_33_12]